MLARIYLLVCVLIWGLTFVATKICLEFLTPLELLSARFLMATPMLWLLMRARGNRLRIAPEHRLMAWISAALFLIHFYLRFLNIIFYSESDKG